MASPRNPSSVTELVQTYLEDIRSNDPDFFKNLANRPQVSGRLFFDLKLDNGTVISFPSNQHITTLLTHADISAIDKLSDAKLTLSTVELIQETAAAIFSMARAAFLEKVSNLTQAEFNKLHRLLAGALCYKIWCLKNPDEKDIVKAKIITAVLNSTEDSTTTLNDLTTKYSRLFKDKFDGIYENFNRYLSTGNIKLALATLTNLQSAMSDLATNIEFCCLDGDYQHQIHRQINFTLKKIKTNSGLARLNKQDSEKLQATLSSIHPINADDDTYAAEIDAQASAQMHKGYSIETSTPSAAAAAAANKPSPRRQLTDANLSPRNAAVAAVSVAKSPSGFMSKGSVIQPKKTVASPRMPNTPTNSPRQ